MGVAVREACSVLGCAGACQSLNNAAQLREHRVVPIESHQLSKSWHRLLPRRDPCVLSALRVSPVCAARRPCSARHKPLLSSTMQKKPPKVHGGGESSCIRLPSILNVLTIIQPERSAFSMLVSNFFAGKLVPSWPPATAGSACKFEGEPQLPRVPYLPMGRRAPLDRSLAETTLLITPAIYSAHVIGWQILIFLGETPGIPLLWDQAAQGGFSISPNPPNRCPPGAIGRPQPVAE
jgi:hypothetical protein